MSDRIANGFVLRAAVTISSPSLAAALCIEGGKVPRGVEIPPSAWASIANLQAMIGAGQLQWGPPTTARRAAPPPPTPPPRPIVARDYVSELRIKLRVIMEQRGCGWSEAEDVVISEPSGEELWKRATNQFANTPRVVQRNGYVTRTGAFSAGSRSIEGFRECLRERAT
jgi:hypothetical protein